jgi:hypothetical protein
MYKALSTTFHKSMDFFAAKEATVGKDAMETFGVRKVPSLVVLKDGAVIIYDGQSVSLSTSSAMFIFSYNRSSQAGGYQSFLEADIGLIHETQVS